MRWVEYDYKEVPFSMDKYFIHGRNILSMDLIYPWVPCNISAIATLSVGRKGARLTTKRECEILPLLMVILWAICFTCAQSNGKGITCLHLPQPSWTCRKLAPTTPRGCAVNPPAGILMRRCCAYLCIIYRHPHRQRTESGKQHCPLLTSHALIANKVSQVNHNA